MNLSGIKGIMAVWEDAQNSIIDQLGTELTINFCTYITATKSAEFDGFFNENVDPTDPTNIPEDDVTKVSKAPMIIKGRFHSDLYNTVLRSDEGIDRYAIGSVQRGDALVTVKLSDVKADSDGRTWFDIVDYVEIVGHPDTYAVLSVERRGLNGPSICDVFLRKRGTK